jgi:hypothetical protein
MKRTAAPSYSNPKPRSDGVDGSLSAAGAQNAEPQANHPPARHRDDFRPPERSVQSQRRIARKPDKHVEPAWEVLDDLPEAVPVIEREIQVIETYLAELLNDLSASRGRRE